MTIYHHRFLQELAKLVPLVVPYAANLYPREPPKLLLALDGGVLGVAGLRGECSKDAMRALFAVVQTHSRY